MQSVAASTLLIDTHVHLYSDTADAMLEHAAQRITTFGGVISLFKTVEPCLMLTETARDQVFDQLAERDDASCPWRRQGDPQGSALWLNHAERGRLLLIAGGQTVTAEGVEVLSLGTRTRFEDGRGIDETIDKVLADGALAVLPYGLGKWLGSRGKLVAQAFERWRAQGVRLGDNAGRPWVLPAPSLFSKSAKLGHAVLPGSDPLRTARGKTTAGSYGVVVNADLDDNNPAGSVIEALRDLSTDAAVFGGRVGVVGCVRDQLALRLNKHLGR